MVEDTVDAVGEVAGKSDERRDPAGERATVPVRPGWDITKLLGPTKWTYYSTYLYVILDVFSRYVVGWLLAYRELASLAERLIAETCGAKGSGRGSSRFMPTAAR